MKANNYSTKFTDVQNINGVDTMNKEYAWLLKEEASKIFRRLENLLKDCCTKLPLSAKGGSSSQQAHCQVEKFMLSSQNGDNVKCVVTLLGDNIVHLEVAIRYPKAPGHVYRAVAQPDVQWKMQQVQDLSDYVLRALNVVNAAIEATKSAETLDGRQVTTFLDQIIGNLHSSRCSVLLPKKKSIGELQENRTNKCFNPPLPSDLLLSFYISSAKLICAAYHMQQMNAATAGRQVFHVYQGECIVPWLNEIITYLNCALQLCQQFRDKLSIFHINDTKQINGASKTSIEKEIVAHF